jgi:secretion/DNA translocation related TadE-like protein
MIAMMALVWLVAVAAMTVGGARVARHRAHTAADLAALAAASHVMAGSARACAVAATVARSGHGRLTACVVRGRIADVEVVVVARAPGFGPLHVAASARAGPVSPAGPRGRQDEQAPGEPSVAGEPGG